MALPPPWQQSRLGSATFATLSAEARICYLLGVGTLIGRLALSFSTLALVLLGCEGKDSGKANPLETAVVPSAVPSPVLAAGSGTNAAVRSGAQDGAALYTKYCALCHGAEGQGYAADNAPSLVSTTFLESATDAFIANGIRIGRPGTAMAAYGKSRGGPLDEVEIRALVRFLRAKGPAVKSLSRSSLEGSSVRGESVYQAQCARCHGTPEARSTAVWLFNPELLRSATPEFLRHAITHGRPPTPMVAFGPTLGEQGVEDLVAFLRSKAPLTAASTPTVDVESLTQLPVVINPGGKPPVFTLRADRFVSIDQVKSALEKKNRMVIIDARSPSDFIQAHIPGAISNGYYDKAGLDRLQNDGTWVLAYCACPHHASGEVIDELRRRGFKHTAILDEGILEWQHRGYPVVGQSSAAVPAPPPTASTAPAPH